MTDIKSSLPEWCDDHWPATTYHHLTTTTSLLHSAASLVLQPSGDHQTGGWLAVGAQLLQFSRRIDWCLIQCQWPATIERERITESECPEQPRHKQVNFYTAGHCSIGQSDSLFLQICTFNSRSSTNYQTWYWYRIQYSPIAWNEINVECIDVEWRAFPVLVIVTIVM